MLFRRYRRKKIIKRDFSKEWMDIIERNVPLYHGLPHNLQQELLDHVKFFIYEKRFRGAKGLEVNDEMKVTIAANACILILNRKSNYFKKLSTVVVYPSSFYDNIDVQDSIGVVQQQKHHVLGQSYQLGLVRLAWDSSLSGGKNIYDGSNLIYHEFAHQLDTNDNVADGTPILASRDEYPQWVETMSKRYKELLAEVKQRKKTFLGSYAATNAAEFFAVATEKFFEKPERMHREQADLYKELQDFYKQDPIQYIERTRESK